MKNYKLDLDALNIPWIDSPFFPTLIKNMSLSETEKEQLYHYHWSTMNNLKNRSLLSHNRYDFHQ